MLKSRRISKFGWKPSLPDIRDYRYGDFHKISAQAALPSSVDLRPICPPVYDQKTLGSCTSQAIAGLFECVRTIEKKPTFTPSRLFIYYNERVYEHSVSEDSGAMIRDGMKVIKNLGAPHENLWWYNPKKFAVKPNKNVYADATKHKCGQYVKLDNTNLNELKSCLASGYPFVFGFTVYSNFESDGVAKSGILPMPGKDEEVLGGHAVLCVGYDDAKQMFLVRNSWSQDWGQGGYFYMPYPYLSNTSLADDFWTLHLAN